MLKGRPKPVLIRSIWISGVAYTSQCFPCLAGTYSKEGFSTCSPCPRNTYSLKGASSCSKCNDVTEYSEPGSAECKLRPACTDQDYFEVHTTCDHDGMTQLTYRWVKPKFCREHLEGAVTLPASGEKQQCPPCNPGFFKNNDSVCIPCPKDSFSDGTSECQQCPAGTEPIHGYEFKWWNTLPDVMQMTCFNIHTNHCRSVDDGWNLADDNIFTSVGSADDDYLILSLEVPGFSVPELDYREGQVVGTITFVFETICSEDCDFFFMLDIGKQVSKLVQTWHGSNEKQSFKYSLSTNATTIFSWAFQRSSPTNDTRKHVSDVAKIFFINVTNVLDGVASYCKSCALDVDTRSCVPCPSGHYIDSSSRFCLPCPSGTHLTNRLADGIVACQPCGLGTKSSADHSTCFSDCSYAQEHFSFNYIELAGLHTKLIGPNFTPWGKKYFHSFNFSICGQQGNALASCVDNITLLSTDSGSEGISRGLICRSNVILSDLHSVTLSSQAIILADWLVGVSTNNTLKKGMVAPSEIFSSSSFPHIPDVIHFYRSSDATPSCQNGRTTTIRLRCAPAKPIDGEFIAPRQCHDGTCDGCTFHFLWLTPAACPLCTQDDVNIIEEACRGGVQKIQHIWKQPHICHRGLSLPEDIKRHCQTISWWMRIGILVGTFLGCLLISLTFYFWKRNRKLEYKYSRLVQNSSGKENEIPTADSCAIMEGEEEEEFCMERHECLGEGC
uniref:Si:ch211-163l21.8 n=1 Tax=Eptatretus burgeri TaxID=7764 RepID=A0A8C4NDK1_EPTBU